MNVCRRILLIISILSFSTLMARAGEVQKEPKQPSDEIAQQRDRLRQQLKKQREELEKAFAQTKTAAAMKKAAAEDKYLFVFFKNEDNEDTSEKLKAFQEETAKLKKVAQTAVINISDKSEKPVLKKYGLAGAPMPLVLAFAPNGAVTGGIPYKVTLEMLNGTMVSKFEQRCLAILQNGKILFLCIQDKSTKLNNEAMSGVNDFINKIDHIIKPEIVKVSPSDKDARAFLNKLGISEKTQKATTVIIAPPATIRGKFEGGTTLEQIQGAFAGGGCC